MAKVCKGGKKVCDGAIFADSHQEYGNPGISDVCEVNVDVPGTYLIDYSFVDNDGAEARVQRSILVKPNCALLIGSRSNKPEVLCNNMVPNEDTGVLEFACSVNTYCAGDGVGEAEVFEDTFPFLELTQVPGVIDKTVNIRKYQTYEPCKTDPETGEMILPVNDFFGTGLCDPGFTAYDVSQKRVEGVIETTRKDLTATVLSCPPVACLNAEKCEDDEYRKKGLAGRGGVTIHNSHPPHSRSHKPVPNSSVTVVFFSKAPLTTDS